MAISRECNMGLVILTSEQLEHRVKRYKKLPSTPTRQDLEFGRRETSFAAIRRGNPAMESNRFRRGARLHQVGSRVFPDSYHVIAGGSQHN